MNGFEERLSENVTLPPLYDSQLFHPTFVWGRSEQLQTQLPSDMVEEYVIWTTSFEHNPAFIVVRYKELQNCEWSTCEVSIMQVEEGLFLMIYI